MRIYCLLLGALVTAGCQTVETVRDRPTLNGPIVLQPAPVVPEEPEPVPGEPVVAAMRIPPPSIMPFADSKSFMLLDDLQYRVGHSNYAIIVPRGFVTDFASVPRMLWSFGLSPYGRFSKAAVIHDYLYWAQGCTREQADNLMMIAMKESGVGGVQAKLLHWGVRLGGKGAWAENRRDRDDQIPRVVTDEFSQVPSDYTWQRYEGFLVVNGVKDPEFPLNPDYCHLGNSTNIP